MSIFIMITLSFTFLDIAVVAILISYLLTLSLVSFLDLFLALGVSLGYGSYITSSFYAWLFFLVFPSTMPTFDSPTFQPIDPNFVLQSYVNFMLLRPVAPFFIALFNFLNATFTCVIIWPKSAFFTILSL